ncbi:coiled-coil domain-containing protein 97-like [Saccoglossus kowalevskii]|uniref:Coiled-coil domain-containing protein 97-like n=1 Tax=Saccoglossus kowalevskii TaxID=10224 RepID=A0ABM0LWR8_SACKO|nr:PREDICTED: coiled-coil domain-containing protein 97-like [Saccoglossus kowalevskii]
MAAFSGSRDQSVTESGETFVLWGEIADTSNKINHLQILDTEPTKAATKIEKNVDTVGMHGLSQKENMIKRIANSDARIKNQQRDEPDLTEEQKMDIVGEILKKKPAIFLERFGTFLLEEDLELFKSFENDYVINFYLEDIKKRLNTKKNATKVRNRRYEAMKELTNKGSYFSEDAMQERDPLMYEHYIGQYLTKQEKEERMKKIDQSDLRFSTILMDFMDRKDIEENLEKQKEAEDDMLEEEDTDTEDEEDEKMVFASREDDESDDSDSALKDTDIAITAEEKNMLRLEYLKTMQIRFISGNDKDFDYSAVDNNVDYDSLDLRQQDEQEKYFDDDVPSIVGIDVSSDDEGPQMKQLMSGKKDEDYDEMEIEDADKLQIEGNSLKCR